jgi:drug/metabolite transporter (DMT)-like permease
VPSGIAALIIAATPFWVVIVEALPPIHHRPTMPALAGILIGLTGIFILVDPFRRPSQTHGYSLLGVAALLLAALSWSLGSVFSHRVNLPKSGLLSSGMQLLIGSGGSFLVGLFSGEARKLDLAGIKLHSVLGLGYLIVVGSLVGFVCYTWLLKAAPTSLVVTYAYVNPLVAIVLGSILAGEILTTRVIIAAPLILSAVVLIQAKHLPIRRTESPCEAVPVTAGDD